MDLSKIYLFFLFGILIIGISGEHQLVKDRQKGALIGKLKKFQHKVSGTVWALDEDKLYLENFHYDGKGPDAFFWMGNDTQPSPRGFIVPYPLDTSHKRQEQLRRFQGEDVILHLPTGKKIVDMKYLSVWCRRFTVDFGHVLIPGNLDPPKKRVLPEFKRLAHAVRSGNVTILDAKTFYIPNLHYDGAGPDAFFWVGNGYEPNQAGKKIPNEMGKYDVLRGYEGEDIEIQLPDNLTVYDIDYLAIWCVEYRHNFGHVLIPPPSELWVPPSLGQTRIKSQEHPKPHEEDDRDIYLATNESSNLDPSDFSNCRQLSDNLQVQWQARSNDVQIRLTGRIEEDEYIAFGLSHVQDRPEMLNSDVVVAYYDADDGSFHAVDYSMTKKSQCDGKLGVCPDERIHGRNDAAIISGDRHNGVTSITYNRPYKTNDRMDIAIQRTSQFVTVIAAIGTLNSKKEASYHNIFVTRDREVIDFTSTGENTCTALIPLHPPAKYEPWPKNFIQGINNFTVAIGPTGGDRGYKAVTGQTSWGISWWVNGLLIPEIHVERGQTYYFQVEGGNDPRNPARYHPFYITDHPEGGFGQKSPEEQQGERVFAGVTYNIVGKPQPNALGRLCEWQHASVDRWKDSLTFDDYRNTLHLSCDYGSPGFLVWTVMEDTPDLVYYQCYTHHNLGWKIHVHDPGYNLAQGGAGSTRSNLGVWLFIVFIALR